MGNMTLININFDLGNISKLLKDGRIDRAYKKMYSVADSLSANETKKYMENLKIKAICKGTTYEDAVSIIEKLYEYRKERTEFHLEEMKKLLKEYKPE